MRGGREGEREREREEREKERERDTKIRQEKGEGEGNAVGARAQSLRTSKVFERTATLSAVRPSASRASTSKPAFSTNSEIASALHMSAAAAACKYVPPPPLPLPPLLV